MSKLSPKEKAIEIYNAFRNENSVMTANVRAKKQAIVCVNEILKTFNINWQWCSKEIEDKSLWRKEYQFWEDVEQEIEKL